ncbi:f-box-like domain-containing protein [Ditylenchus destructor]|nr:f-box-like domain-containing protein [Ditylenchus destructor]
MLEILLVMKAIGASINVNDLPDIILSKILKDLPWKERLKVERVCRKWYYVGRNLSWTTYRIFDNEKYENWTEARTEELEPFFDRCGRHLRHLTLHKWPPVTVLRFIRMAPNIQHLGLSCVILNATHLLEIAQTVPKLKSLELQFCRERSDESDSPNTDFAECLRSFQFLEYLCINEANISFHERKSACNLPHSLKHLALYYVTNVDEILHATKECKDLEGLSLTDDSYSMINTQGWQAVSEMKNLKYLAVSQIGDVDTFETVLSALPNLKVLNVKCNTTKVK